MEQLLESRILTRGNQLLLEAQDGVKQTLFRSLVADLKEYVRDGQVPDPELVRAVYRSVTSDTDGGEARSLRQKHIVLPNGIKVFPRSRKQAGYIESMESHELVFAIGPAGTGKTYLAVAQALKEILGRKKKKLILTRPVVEAGESLGFLPGDLTQKISPYLRPLYDAIDSFVSIDVLNRLEENRIIEVAPLAYMRGRNLKDCYIILDEAQNTTKEQMKMFLTRIGEGSTTVVTGDITQIDLPEKKKCGLLHAAEILEGIPGIVFTSFDSSDVVRSTLVKKIVHAYESENPA